MSEQPEVHLFTDGGCSGNPGPGGWAFLLRHPATDKQLEGSGGEPETTNNRMELAAVIEEHELGNALGEELLLDGAARLLPLDRRECVPVRQQCSDETGAGALVVAVARLDVGREHRELLVGKERHLFTVSCFAGLGSPVLGTTSITKHFLSTHQLYSPRPAPSPNK